MECIRSLTLLLSSSSRTEVPVPISPHRTKRMHVVLPQLCGHTRQGRGVWGAEPPPLKTTAIAAQTPRPPL